MERFWLGADEEWLLVFMGCDASSSGLDDLGRAGVRSITSLNTRTRAVGMAARETFKLHRVGFGSKPDFSNPNASRKVINPAATTPNQAGNIAKQTAFVANPAGTAVTSSGNGANQAGDGANQTAFFENSPRFWAKGAGIR